MLEALISRFVEAPSLVGDNAQNSFKSYLTALANHERAQEFFGSTELASDDFWPHPDSWKATYRPYNVVAGILQIPVRGILLHDFPWQVGGYATGYTYIWRAVQRGLEDPTVKGIALCIHSPGGEVAGCFDVVDRIYGARGTKPIRAFADEYAYSAAYAVASAADSITVSRTGGVGSIGVVTMHVDMSKLMSDIGYKITFIYRGKHKVDGNAYEPLPDDVKARIQERIDALGEIFEASVARNRGIDATTVRGFQAATFLPHEAVSNGLADAIGPLDDAMAAFVADLSVNEGDEQMSTTKDTAVDQAAIDNARAEGFEKGKAEGYAAGLKEGAAAERQRIAAILNSEEGKKRPKAALSTALKSDMSVEQATDFLADLAEEKNEQAARSSAAAFDLAMTKTGNPELGSESGNGERGADDDATAVGQITSLAASVGLPGLRKRAS